MSDLYDNMGNMKEKISAQNLISEFKPEVEHILSILGKFTGAHDEKEAAREFCNRFYANLLSMEKNLETDDPLLCTLVQRYNHEMMLRFFYIFASKNSSEKAEEFFSYEEKLRKQPDLQRWESDTGLKKFVPPWTAPKEILTKIYKKLSDLAHPNTISMRLIRRTQKSQRNVTKDAASLIVFEITTCFLYKPFRDLIFGEVDTVEFCSKMREFQAKCTDLIKHDIT